MALLAVCLLPLWSGWADDLASQLVQVIPGVAYRNIQSDKGPWSIYVVRVQRTNGLYQVHSVHARNRALGLSPLSDQIQITKGMGNPVAGINGDFYERGGSFAGSPRGMQVVEGELVHGPTGGVVFWVDPAGEPHATNIDSGFSVTFPNGSSVPIGVNGEPDGEQAQLYTPRLGKSTKTRTGPELVLEREGDGAWLPLMPGRTYKAKVAEVVRTGNSPIAAGTLVLSLGAGGNRAVKVEPGDIVTISTATSPSLEGVKTAIGGGPVLVSEGKAQRIAKPRSGGFEVRSMGERHPRSAVGWDKSHYYFVEVDGRQQGSVGMTLNELGVLMAQVGCQGAMTLDGGGSATFWCNGSVRNNPCEGGERAVANSLVIVKDPSAAKD